MKRDVRLEDISDGKLYGRNDLVKADCGDCKGCSACCCGMGESIVLDPLDVFRLTTGLNYSFEGLLADKLELNLADGVILPNLKMNGEKESCVFLNEKRRCSIHGFRPGICRLFPLGRYYENRSFRYFLQAHECKKTNRTKIKVRKWLDTPDIAQYENFVNSWHYFLLDLQELLQNPDNQGAAKTINLYCLNLFFVNGYDRNQDFYEQFQKRLEEAERFVETTVQNQ